MNASTAMSAAARKAKSRANRTAEKAAEENMAAKERIYTLRAKNRLQKACLSLRNRVSQNIRDDVDKKLADLEYGIISSKGNEPELSTVWTDPNFESMISGKVALAKMYHCGARCGDGGKNNQEYSTLLFGSEITEKKMKEVIAYFKKKVRFFEYILYECLFFFLTIEHLCSSISFSAPRGT